MSWRNQRTHLEHEIFALVLCPWICSSVSGFLVYGNLSRICILLLCENYTTIIYVELAKNENWTSRPAVEVEGGGALGKVGVLAPSSRSHEPSRALLQQSRVTRLALCSCPITGHSIRVKATSVSSPGLASCFSFNSKNKY